MNRFRGFAIVLVASCLPLAAVPAAALGADAQATAATCSDYSNQAAAQRAADTRDPDGDGIYCESLPCPCLKPGQPNDREQPTKRARIVRVVDGDTVKVRYGKKRRTVRVIGIDTPETRKPGVAVECGGAEATAHMKKLAPSGATVTLRTDPTQDTLDRYGRLLAYIGRRHRDLGRSQVSAGWAKTYVYGGNPFQRAAAYRSSQAKAKKLRRGIYGKCGGDFHSEQPG